MRGRAGTAEAEPLFEQAFSTLIDTLSPSHPNTLIAQQNYTGVLIRLHKDRQALSHLKTIETHLSSRAVCNWPRYQKTGCAVSGYGQNQPFKT